MKILLMPDSFKGSLPAGEVAEILKRGFSQVFPAADYRLLPVGDGGEGTLDALSQSIVMEERSQTVTGWDGQPFSMRYMYFQEQAFFEMADLVGLPMFSEEQQAPLTISTVGLGELVLKLQQTGIKKIYIGVGGSATVDGGIGFAAGLGYRFYDEQEKLLEPLGCNVGRVARVDDSKVPKITAEVYAVTDVKNVLCGKAGATYIFGPQKGLKQTELAEVDQAMNHFYQIVSPTIFTVSGSGAGGGLAAGIIQFAQGEIIHGIDFVLDALNFEKEVQDADYIIVGEGKMDRQSMSGKAPVGIAQRAPKETSVIAICGSVETQLSNFQDYGITACFPIIGEVGTLEKALKEAEVNLERTAMNVASLIKSTRGKDID